MAVASIWSLLYVWVRGRMPKDATRREAALTAMPRTETVTWYSSRPTCSANGEDSSLLGFCLVAGGFVLLVVFVLPVVCAPA
jgi:hypothetical protein